MGPEVSTNGKLRVVTLIDALTSSGGGERLAIQTATGLDPSRFERTLCVTRWGPGRGDEPDARREIEALRAADVRLLTLPRRSRASVAAWRPLWSMLRRERIDVLHAHKFGSNVWGTILGRSAGVPVVIAHEHSWSYERQPLRRFLDRELVGRGVDAFIAVSQQDRRRMIDVEGVRADRIVVVANGIPAMPEGDGATVREELDIAADAPVIGAVARLWPEKGLDMLVRASARLSGRFPGLRIVVVGDGPERVKLERLAAELGLGRMVMLLGERSDVHSQLAALDVGVLTSRREGSPLAVIEYMAAGLPIVATRVGGIPDLIEHGVDGLLIEPDDVEGLVTAIAWLLDDRERAARLGRNARERQRRQFDLAVMIRRLEDLYETIARMKAQKKSSAR